MKKITIYIVLSLTFFACKQDSNSIKQDLPYSVISFFKNKTDLENSLDRLQSTIRDTLIVLNDNSLKIGLFGSYRAASDKGFELYADTLIENFDVLYIDSVIRNDYNPFYFVGQDMGRPALYKTDLLNLKTELVWSRWGREIMELHRSGNRENLFFTTSLAEDIRGNFPLVMDARLYCFDRELEKVRLVRYFGRGLNLSAGWENDTTFTAYFTILDSMLTSTIIQKQFKYSTEGEFKDSTERKFELLKDGIPIPSFTYINPVSPNLRYKVAIAKNDSIYSLNVIDELNGINHPITQINGELKENRWDTQNEYLFLKFTSNDGPDTTGLYIVDLKAMELVKYFRGAGQKNFILIGNLLIFDNDFGEESFITLYRYKKDQIFSEIKIPAGCGVNSIPGVSKLNK